MRDVTEYCGIEEAWIRFACEIGRTRSRNYKIAYRNYIGDRSKSSLSKLQHYERKLRDSITQLDDADIRILQKQAMAEFLGNPRLGY